MTIPLAAIEFFGQKAEPHDLIIIALLVVLEGVLSIDNALVLGLLAKRVPKKLQRRALTYGLVGALIFRMAAIGLATFLLQWTFAKFLGGAYLIYVAVKHFFFEDEDEEDAKMALNEEGKVAVVLTSPDAQPTEITHTKSGKTITTTSLFFW